MCKVTIPSSVASSSSSVSKLSHASSPCSSTPGTILSQVVGSHIEEQFGLSIIEDSHGSNTTATSSPQLLFKNLVQHCSNLYVLTHKLLCFALIPFSFFHDYSSLPHHRPADYTCLHNCFLPSASLDFYDSFLLTHM